MDRLATCSRRIATTRAQFVYSTQWGSCLPSEARGGGAEPNAQAGSAELDASTSSLQLCCQSVTLSPFSPCNARLIARTAWTNSISISIESFPTQCESVLGLFTKTVDTFHFAFFLVLSRPSCPSPSTCALALLRAAAAAARIRPSDCVLHTAWRRRRPSRRLFTIIISCRSAGWPDTWAGRSRRSNRAPALTAAVPARP